MPVNFGLSQIIRSIFYHCLCPLPPPQIIPFSKGRYLTLRYFFSTEPNFAQSILAWAIVVVSYKMVQSTSLSRRLLINKYKIINISQISHQLLMNVMSYVYHLWILYHSVFWGIRTNHFMWCCGFQSTLNLCFYQMNTRASAGKNFTLQY